MVLERYISYPFSSLNVINVDSRQNELNSRRPDKILLVLGYDITNLMGKVRSSFDD